MPQRGFKTFLKSSAAVAFLAVAAPSDAPAQSFDMMSPNSIMNPMHPFNPLTDPFNVYGTYDDGSTDTQEQKPKPATEATSPAQKEQQGNAGLALLFGLGAAFGIAGAIAIASGSKPKPPPPLTRTPFNGPRGGDF